MKSRAVVLVADREFEIREIEVPDPLPPGYALLKVEANGLCGSDYDLFTGSLRSPMLTVPCVPGHEIVGTVVQATDDARKDMGVTVGELVAVEGWIRCGRCRSCAAGDGNYCRDVFVYSGGGLDMQPGNGLSGGLAEYMVLRPGTTVHRFRSDVAIEDAVLHNPLGNGLEWTCRAGGVRLGDWVLIFGGGQRGIACTIAAKEAGASQIIVTGLRRDAHKLDLAREYGATATINVEDENVRETVLGLTDGDGVDVALDLVPGSTEPVSDAIELVRRGGTIVFCGVKGRAMDAVPIDKIRQKALRIQGVIGVSRWSTEQAVRLIDEQRYDFSKLHTHVFGLEDIEKAVKILGNEVEGENPMHITIKP